MPARAALALPSRRLVARTGGPVLLAAALLTLLADPAAAQVMGGAGGGSFITFLQNIVNLITGQAGQLIAVIAIALSGIAWMMGAFSPRGFFSCVAGVAIVFSAAWIVQQITGGA